MITIEVKNQGITNSNMYAELNAKYNIEGLLNREGIIQRIKDLAESKSFCNNNETLLFYFNNLVNDIYTCIKVAREHNFEEEFWKDWVIDNKNKK